MYLLRWKKPWHKQAELRTITIAMRLLEVLRLRYNCNINETVLSEVIFEKHTKTDFSVICVFNNPKLDHFRVRVCFIKKSETYTSTAGEIRVGIDSILSRSGSFTISDTNEIILLLDGINPFGTAQEYTLRTSITTRTAAEVYNLKTKKRA